MYSTIYLFIDLGPVVQNPTSAKLVGLLRVNPGLELIMLWTTRPWSLVRWHNLVLEINQKDSSFAGGSILGGIDILNIFLVFYWNDGSESSQIETIQIKPGESTSVIMF